eukprot:scaffold19193_cov62-Phaeocystis_antarctica.AAC.5
MAARGPAWPPRRTLLAMPRRACSLRLAAALCVALVRGGSAHARARTPAPRSMHVGGRQTKRLDSGRKTHSEQLGCCATHLRRYRTQPTMAPEVFPDFGS